MPLLLVLAIPDHPWVDTADGKSAVDQICKAKKITVQQLWDEICVPLLWKEAQAAKVKKPKTTGEKRADEMI